VTKHEKKDRHGGDGGTKLTILVCCCDTMCRHNQATAPRALQAPIITKYKDWRRMGIALSRINLSILALMMTASSHLKQMLDIPRQKKR
jgi:hypothetical protein